jgi:hypothetical protein
LRKHKISSWFNFTAISVFNYHGRKLRVGVVRRSDFNDIGSGQVNPLKAADDRADLASRPSARFRRARGRSECRVDGVDVDRQIDGRVLA